MEVFSRISFMLMIGSLSMSSVETACLEGSDESCLQRVRSLVVDRSAFWFGTSFSTICPEVNDGTFDCYLSKPDADGSIMGRFTSEKKFEANSLNFIVKVTFHQNSSAASSVSYMGCGRKVYVSRTLGEIYMIDPVDEKVYRPFDLVDMPKITWPATVGELYTMVVYDVGFSVTHALFTNIRGGQPSDGQVVKSYSGPGVPVNRTNIYIFAVFKQWEEINTGEFTQYWTKNAGDFSAIAKKFNLKGPIGINILRVTGDEYGAGMMRRLGMINYCPFYVGKEFSNYMRDNGQVSFLPESLSLTASVDIIYKSKAFTHTSCCTEYHTGLRIFHRDDTTYTQSTHAVVVRDRPTIDIVPAAFISPPSQILTGKSYTLLLVDAESAVVNKTDNVLVHWMVTNIPATLVAAGNEVLPYSSPHPEVRGEFYMFLFYEQTSKLAVSETKRYAGTDCVPAETGKCHYRIGDFIGNNNLTLIGFRQMSVISDEYSQHLLYTLRLKSQMDTCKDHKGCPNGIGNRVIDVSLYAIMLFLLAFIF